MYSSRWARRAQLAARPLVTRPRIRPPRPVVVRRPPPPPPPRYPSTPRVTPASLLNDQSVFQLGGMGTYILSGPTNCGKNYWLEGQLKRAVTGIPFENVFVFSSTGELNDDWDFLEENTTWPPKQPRPAIHHYADFKALEDIITRIETTLKAAKAKGCKLADWKAVHATLFIVNDFFGMGNLSSPNNPFNMMASKIRHLGGYLVLFTQHVNKLHPCLYSNSRAIISFDATLRAWEALKENCAVDVPLIRIRLNNRKLYHYSILFVATADPQCMPLTTTALPCLPLTADGRVVLAPPPPTLGRAHPRRQRRHQIVQRQRTHNRNKSGSMARL